MEDNFVYEEAVAELESIVEKLNSGKCSLDESISLYTRGVELASACKKRLSEVEQKISEVNLSTFEEESFIEEVDNE